MDIEHLRSFRVFGYAIFDFVVSYLGIFLISPILVKIFGVIKIKTRKVQWVILALPIGIIFHVIFKQDTPFNQAFLDTNGGFIEKLIVIGSVILALDLRRKN